MTMNKIKALSLTLLLALATSAQAKGLTDNMELKLHLEEMVFTDSIPYRGTCPKVKEISVSGMLAE